MDEAVAERIASGLELSGSQPIAEMMHQAAGASNRNEDYEGYDEGAEGLDEEGLHELIILEAPAKKRPTNREETFRTMRRECLGDS